MPGAQQFQRFADLCIEMSRDTSDSERSAALINMAKTWRSLAAEAVRFEEMVRDLDRAFDAPDPREPQPRPHRQSH